MSNDARDWVVKWITRLGRKVIHHKTADLTRDEADQKAAQLAAQGFTATVYRTQPSDASAQPLGLEPYTITLGRADGEVAYSVMAGSWAWALQIAEQKIAATAPVAVYAVKIERGGRA